jgi:hypothetical protein
MLMLFVFVVFGQITSRRTLVVSDQDSSFAPGTPFAQILAVAARIQTVTVVLFVGDFYVSVFAHSPATFVIRVRGTIHILSPPFFPHRLVAADSAVLSAVM